MEYGQYDTAGFVRGAASHVPRFCAASHQSTTKVTCSGEVTVRLLTEGATRLAWSALRGPKRLMPNRLFLFATPDSHSWL
jgi:hypothetical protein